MHGLGRYSYPNLSHVSSNSVIDILCNNCGNEFRQTIHSHLNKRTGCVRCNKSKSEQLITSYLLSNNINFIPQWKHNDCFYKRQLYFDFYIPEINLCIEYDGEQHFSSRRDDNGERLTFQKIKDEIKNNFCYKNSINIERISYRDNLSFKLKDILDKYGLVEINTLNKVTTIFSKKDTKNCSICKIEKNKESFNRSSRSLDGRKSYCRECSSIIYKKNKKSKNG